MVTYGPQTYNDSDTALYFSPLMTVQGARSWWGATLFPLVIQGHRPINSSIILVSGFQGHPGSRRPDPLVEDRVENGTRDFTHALLAGTQLEAAPFCPGN